MRKPFSWVVSVGLSLSPFSIKAGVGVNTNTPAAPNDDSIFHDTMVGLTWPQVQQAAQNNVLVLVPVGVIEEHGPHMSLGADTYLACLRSRRIKAALEALGTKAIIARPSIGNYGRYLAVPRIFQCPSRDDLLAYHDMCQSLNSWGFRRLRL
jgi:creatinine amidohydrolase